MNPHRYLIIQLGDIGDMVLSTPALAALREAHPSAHIAVLTSEHAVTVLDNTNLADEVIRFRRQTFDSLRSLVSPQNLKVALGLAAQLRRGRYDTVLLFHHFSTRAGAMRFAALVWSTGASRVIGLQNGHGFFLTEVLPDQGFGARHQAQYWLDLVALVGASSAPRPAQVGMSAADAEWASERLKEARGAAPAPFVAIHAGSGGYSLARRWDAERFAAVADRLIEHTGAHVVLVGGRGDDSDAVRAAMTHEVLDLTGQTSLGQLAAALQRCALFIGADSGVMHIAAAVGTPVAAIFGPSNHLAWAPWTPDSRSSIIRSGPECSPCSYVGTEVGLRHGCSARTCMRMVTVEQVWRAAEDLLQNAAPAPVAPPVPNAEDRRARVTLLGIPIDRITYRQWLERIAEWIDHGQTCQHVCTTNPEMLMIAQKDSLFRYILRRSALNVADGVGLLWAAKLRGQPIPERVTGSDGVPLIAETASQRGWRLFLLGAAPGIAEQAADVLFRRFPGLQIAGTYSGSPAAEEEDALVEMVNRSGADLLFVAYGAPEQDKWIARNLPRLQTKMAMGVGGTFDFIAGVVPRAPLWMRRSGLEWLFRLLRQPWRFWRMLRLPRFMMAILLEKSHNLRP